MKPCCKNPCPPIPTPDSIDFFAQYGVQANPASGSHLPLFPVFEEGNRIQLVNNSEILLPEGFLYLVNVLLLATTELDSYMQIVPRINGNLTLLYSYFAPSGSAARNTSASGSFTTNAALTEDARLSFHLTYPDTVRNIDISGAISITPVVKLRKK